MDQLGASVARAGAHDSPRAGTPPSGPAPGAASAKPIVPDYELLRCIGRGGYGDVWLARSTATGVLRAAKIVWRQGFEDDRPFHREFEGLQHFERLSREHPSQLALFHIGRSQSDDYFYYVMELADDLDAQCRVPNTESAPPAAPAPNPATPIPHSYSPHTLRADLSHGRLPADRVFEIGLALTEALGHLHMNGLVHRDVKPSNVIFVNGRPKLADIGLVTDASDTLSIVGTEGYLPPDGPGTPQADLFALGKVLYEATTGQDRRQFPQLPPDLGDWPEAAKVFEINEIVLKACAPNLSERYASAEEMRAELALLVVGKSVKRKRALQRIYSLGKKISLAAALVAIAGILAVSLIHGPPDTYLHSAIQEVNDLTAQGDYCSEGNASERLDQAVVYYNRAIELDRGFVPAYMGLLRASVSRGAMEGAAPAELRREFRAEAAKLAEVAASYAEAKTAIAMVKWLDWQFPEALSDARSATKMRAASRQGSGVAHTVYGFLLLETGNPDAAQDEYFLAEKLLPSNATINHHLGHPYFVKHDFKQALEHYQKSLDLEPRQATGHYWKQRVFEETGDFMGAIQELEESDRAVGLTNAERTLFYPQLRDAVRRGGKKDYWAERLSRALKEPRPDLYFIAKIYARLEDKQNAYSYLNQACEQHSFTQGLMSDLCWDHKDPQFRAIAERIGLLQLEKAH